MKPGLYLDMKPASIDFAETDLTKAFDHLSPVLAQHALHHFGAHNAITATLPRLGRHAGFAQFTELFACSASPSRGVPQGDPARHWH